MTRNKQDYSANVSRAARVFEQHGQFILTVIRWKTPNQSVVEDLYQDLFLSLVARPIPPEVQNVRSFLYKAITNDILDAMRRTDRYRKHVRKFAKNAKFPINTDHPADALHVRERVLQVVDAFEKRLEPTEAKALRLRYGKNLEIREIAAKMKVKRRSVSKYIATGLQKMRGMVSAEVEGPE